MEKHNNYKIISIIGLVIAVFALATGFAAYSATLNIESSVTVSGDEFSPYVVFTGSPTCEVNGTSAQITSAGTVNEHDWSGLNVVLTKPGDSITCEASIQNASLLDAYLESIQATTPLTCTSEGTSNPATSYTEACEGLKLNVTVDTYDIESSSDASVGTSTQTLQSGTITDIVIPAKNGSTISNHTVTVTISYDANASVADGDFKVTVPTISMVYNTED